MIDLDATGPVYRGHVLSRIVESFQDGWVEGDYPSTPGWDKPTWIAPPVSTRGWARLDCRVLGNPWGLSVSETELPFPMDGRPVITASIKDLSYFSKDKRRVD